MQHCVQGTNISFHFIIHTYIPLDTHLSQSQACKGTTTRCPKKKKLLSSSLFCKKIASLLFSTVILLMSIVNEDSIHQLLNNKRLNLIGYIFSLVFQAFFTSKGFSPVQSTDVHVQITCHRLKIVALLTRKFRGEYFLFG